MRDIRFRGRDIDGVWRYGNLTYRDGGLGIQEVNEYGPRNEEPCGGVHVESFNIDPETVGQATGIPDDTGTHIFEGDILENVEGKPFGFVYWEPAGFWMAGRPDDPDNLHLKCWVSGRAEYYKIVGIIHDNPELLDPKRDTVEA